MKSIMVSVMVLAGCEGLAQQTNDPALSDEELRMRVFRAERSRWPLELPDDNFEYGRTPVRFMEPLKTEALQKLLPDVAVFRLASSSDLIHGVRYSALLVDTNGSPTHLKSAEDVCGYLFFATRNVTNETQALQIARAFADLRSYRIVESPPDFPDVRPPEEQPEPRETDYKLEVEDLENEWRVFATMLTSEYSGRYERFVFSLYKPPGAGMTVKERTLIRVRNYVY